MHVQWPESLYIAATLVEQGFGRYNYIGVAFIERLFRTQTVHLGPGFPSHYTEVAFIQGWPLRGRVPLYCQKQQIYPTPFYIIRRQRN